MTYFKQPDLSRDAFRNRLSRARLGGQFHGYKISAGKERRNILSLAHRSLKLAWRGPLTIPRDSDERVPMGTLPITDDLKASMGNAANSAKFVPSAFNFYKGLNLRTNSDGTTERTAYAMGSGTTTIGLDQRTLKLHQMTPLDVDLMSSMTRVVSLANPDWEKRLQLHPLNQESGKIYYSFLNDEGKIVTKCTDFHTDCTFTKSNRPMRNNSQTPNTLTVLLTFGDPKNLWFRKQKSKEDYKDSSLLHIHQNHGSIVVLDGIDEQFDRDGYQWKHRSDMIDPNYITFTLVFRSVQISVAVHEDGRLANPPQMSDYRQDNFDSHQDVMTTDEYDAKCKDLDERMERFFQKYKPT